MEKLCVLPSAKGFVSGVLISTVDAMGASHMSPLLGQFIRLSAAIGIAENRILQKLSSMPINDWRVGTPTPPEPPTVNDRQIRGDQSPASLFQGGLLCDLILS